MLKGTVFRRKHNLHGYRHPNLPGMLSTLVSDETLEEERQKKMLYDLRRGLPEGIEELWGV